MGQLEKYGLYVLCLLIFLILGVTLWGSPEVAAKVRDQNTRTTNNDFNAGSERLVVDPPVSLADGGGGVASIGALIEANPIPRPGERKGEIERPEEQPSPGPGSGQAQPDPADRPGPGGAPVTVERPKHVVRLGDTFERIAAELLGDRRLQTEIQRLNPKVDPRRMQLGSTLYLPTPSEVAQLKGGGSAKPVDRPAVASGRIYTIVKGDTLERISRSQLGSPTRVDEIRQLNPGVVDTNLKIGAPLRLPAK